jgi:MSHA biogenesis protein MshL
MLPQVLIEVEMLDISKDTSEQLGIKYGTTIEFYGAQRQVLYPWNQNKILNSGGHVFTNQYTAGLIDASGLSVMLQFLKTQTDTKYLANPKILTLNNQSAQIKISTDEAIGIITATGGSEGITTQNVEAERAQTGVFLTVTPQVNLQTGEITMAIVPKVSEARTGASFNTGNGTVSFKDPEERMSKTVLRVKDNETIFLGGLKKNNETTVVTKIPILGDIPLLGGLFRHKDTTNVERELIIFITPKIIYDQDRSVPRNLTNDLATREQSYPAAKKNAVERDLLIMEQKLNK